MIISIHRQGQRDVLSPLLEHVTTRFHQLQHLGVHKKNQNCCHQIRFTGSKYTSTLLQPRYSPSSWIYKSHFAVGAGEKREGGREQKEGEEGKEKRREEEERPLNFYGRPHMWHTHKAGVNWILLLIICRLLHLHWLMLRRWKIKMTWYCRRWC